MSARALTASSTGTADFRSTGSSEWMLTTTLLSSPCLTWTRIIRLSARACGTRASRATAATLSGTRFMVDLLRNQGCHHKDEPERHSVFGVQAVRAPTTTPGPRHLLR